jgi:bacillithiol biosynthesis cysteine-adding enzyme BshC
MNPAYFKNSVLTEDYLNNSAKLQPFYSQALYPDWQTLAANVMKNFNQAKVIEELISQNSYSHHAFVKNNCKLLLQKNSVIVITGQQLGLMISPLYIIYKTISTLKLAEKLNREHKDFHFIPVYWLEGEDHDFDEVRSLQVLSASSQLKKISLQNQDEWSGFSMNKRYLKEDIKEVIKELKECMQATSFSEELFKRLEEIYQPGTNWLDSFKKHMSQLFAESGILFFNAGSQRIKELSIPFFKQVIQTNRNIVNAFKSGSEEMEKSGFPNQVNIQEDRAYLFYCPEGGGREALLYKNGNFLLKNGKQFSTPELLKEAELNPAYFSSTVLTRPLWQSWLLPTVTYIAGSAEIAYWGQLKKAFGEMKLVMPHVQPRHSVTLIEPKIERFTDKLNIDLNTIHQDKDEFIKDFFITSHLGDVTEKLAEFENQAKESRQKIQELIKMVDSTLSDPVNKSYSAIAGIIEKLHSRLSNRIKEKEEITQKQLIAIHEAVLPGGNLQERVLSSVYFENKYGPDWVKGLLEKINDSFEEHQIVHL